MKATWQDQDGQVFFRDIRNDGGLAYIRIEMNRHEAATPESFRLRLVDALLELGSPKSVQEVILKSSVLTREMSER